MPLSSNGRQLKIFTGSSHNFEKNLLKCGWSGNDKFITAGSADRTINIWIAETGQLKHRLGGHTGSVNETSLHPSGQLIASCSSDSSVCVGELSQ